MLCYVMLHYTTLQQVISIIRQYSMLEHSEACFAAAAAGSWSSRGPTWRRGLYTLLGHIQVVVYKVGVQLRLQNAYFKICQQTQCLLNPISTKPPLRKARIMRGSRLDLHPIRISSFWSRGPKPSQVLARGGRNTILCYSNIIVVVLFLVQYFCNNMSLMTVWLVQLLTASSTGIARWATGGAALKNNKHK